MRLDDKYIQYVKATVDVLVAQTDFPVSAKVLEESGVSDRARLRKLERMGVLKSLIVDGGSGQLKTYYTEDALPKYVREEREVQNHGGDHPAEQPDVGEGGQGGQEGDASGYEEAKRRYEEIYGEAYDQEGGEVR